MDSRRWLIGLGALAALLAAALVADLAGGGGEAPGGRIFTDWDPSRVTAVRIERRGQRPVVVERKGATWRLAPPDALPADPSAVADLLGTLEILAARRRAEGAVADPVLSVTVERSGQRPITLDVAADSGRTDRVWLSRRGEDRRALIDGYQLRALDVAAADLRERRPFHGRLAGATRIAVITPARRVELEGTPWRIGGVRADPERVATLVAALDRLRATSFPTSVPLDMSRDIIVDGRSGLTVLTIRGDCPDGGAAATGWLGAVCLPRAALAEIEAIAGGSLVDRALLAAAPDQVTGIRVSAGERSIEIARTDQPDVVRDWAARFTAAAAPGPPIPADRLPAIGAVAVDTGDGREELAILRAPDGTPTARRAGEPIAFRLVDPSLVDPSPRNFRSLDLVSADPTALRSARRGGEHIERGELLEEWRALAPAGASVDPAAAEALAATVATLRAVRVAPDRPRRGERTIAVELAPPPGESESIHLHIHLAAGPRGACTVRLGDDPTAFELAPDACAALERPWTRR